MRFTIDRELLLTTLINVSRGLSDKKPLPVLTGIKIEAKNNQLVFITTNKEISVQIILEENQLLSIEEEGNCVVPGKYFVEIAKKLEGKLVEFTLFEETTIKIVSEKSDFTLVAYDKDFFPNINFEPKQTPINFTSKKLKTLIKQTTFAAATSESRIILTSVNFVINNDRMIVTATDSFRLARKEEEIEPVSEKQIINIPSKSLEELSKILDDSDDVVAMYLVDKTAMFIYKNVSFITRLVEGIYPDTSSLFPKEQLLSVTFNKTTLLSAVDRASLFINPENFSVVKINITPNKAVEFSSNSTEIGKVVEEVEALQVSENLPFQTAFSTKYLSDALRAFDSPEVTINFTGEIKPAVIRGNKEPNLLQLLLPVRVF